MKQTHFIIRSVKEYLTLALMGSICCNFTFSLSLLSETVAQKGFLMSLTHTVLSLMQRLVAYFDDCHISRCPFIYLIICIICLTLFITNDYIPPAYSKLK